MQTDNLTIQKLLRSAIPVGIAQYFRLLINALFWLLTLWVPYLSLGTSLALVRMTVDLAHDRSIRHPFTFVFQPEHRNHIGDWFLLLFPYAGGILMGTMIGILPGVILILGWTPALMLCMDSLIFSDNPDRNDRMDASALLRQSFACTDGHRGRICLAGLILLIFINSVIILSALTAREIDPLALTVICVLSIPAVIPLGLHFWAHIYATLFLNAGRNK